MARIVFVCTGNIFRSVSAEYALRRYLGSAQDVQDGVSNWRIESAGTFALPQNLNPVVIELLRQRGMDASEHRQRKLDAAIIASAGVVVAMSTDHRDFIAQEFGGYPAPLFNEIVTGRADPLLDMHEKIPDWFDRPQEALKYVEQTIDYIHSSMPTFVRNAPRFFRDR